MDIILGIMVIAPLTFEISNCLLPTAQNKYENTGVVCNWTDDNFEKNFYGNIGDIKPPEYRWELKREYLNDNFIEKWVRKQYWKRRETNGT